MVNERMSRAISGAVMGPARRSSRYGSAELTAPARNRAARLVRAAVFASVVLWAGPVGARVLQEGDFQKMSEIKMSFLNVTGDLDRSSKRTDISSEDVECMKSALRELQQIADELSSYQYLITIESEIGEFGDDSALKGILQFALDRALAVLDGQRKRLSQLLDQCSRSPLALSKTQQAIRLVDTTAAALKSLQPRL